LPNVIKIDPYNFQLYRFKVGAFFETQCINIAKETVIYLSKYHNGYSRRRIFGGLPVCNIVLIYSPDGSSVLGSRCGESEGIV